MGNMHCPFEDTTLLASVARDVCPFPVYNFSPHLENMLSINSSFHLSTHYAAVQSSLTPKQLEDFTRGLRTTFGRRGRVTLGGVGVVALSLAILFDSLAKQVKGEYVPESGPIPNLFVKDPRGYYPPIVYTASEYLRLVPHIANNPTRMRVETERYINQLAADAEAWKKLERNQTTRRHEDVLEVNGVMAELVGKHLKIHLTRITNGTLDVFSILNIDINVNALIFNLNCVPNAVHKKFLAKVERFGNHMREALNACLPRYTESDSWVEHAARSEIGAEIALPYLSLFSRGAHDFATQKEDFDLKANAVEAWVK